ncbi:hypothetical protein [Alterisphingorhabdus coralli]|uniref:Uncharacterized protein n=1 Tax=Alterisphingorhabdus coralli TaxID=3071408 RepID=A0AA97F8F1_9SPHN|nr:hypothetical protein [Parasphingorhabdus sp. SCSIO 66989]WOE76349.1 hypothetical protein RB602_06450 [Parasphingorhabdus sp. SCSIO 66989]
MIDRIKSLAFEVFLQLIDGWVMVMFILAALWLLGIEITFGSVAFMLAFTAYTKHRQAR